MDKAGPKQYMQMDKAGPKQKSDGSGAAQAKFKWIGQESRKTQTAEAGTKLEN